MIYIKFRYIKKVYNTDNLEALKYEHPLHYRRVKALIRVIKNLLNSELKTYPSIDIVISYKKQSATLGRIYYNRHRIHREYKFIRQLTGNPFIVLFWQRIECYYNWHCVKGLKAVLLHEYGHFKDWLLNNRLGHNKNLKSRAGDNLESELTQVLNYIKN